jgi:hypothetical protein
MPVERSPGGTSLIDVLDRVLDKGIVIDAWVRVSLVGIDLITVEARVVVASIDTYLRYADAMGLTGPVARPPLTAAREELTVEEETLTPMPPIPGTAPVSPPMRETEVTGVPRVVPGARVRTTRRTTEERG